MSLDDASDYVDEEVLKKNQALDKACDYLVTIQPPQINLDFSRIYVILI